MFDQNKITKCLWKTLFSFLIISICSSPINAQTSTSEHDFLEDIKAGNNGDWNFSSENESISIKDNINKLEEYNFSEVDSIDVQLTEENRRWGNRGRAKDYSIEAEIYDY